MSQASRALAYAFETGALAERRAFFLRAEDPPFAEIQCELNTPAGFPEARAREAQARERRRARSASVPLDQAQGKRNFANIARAWALLEPGGALVCSGSNDDGAASLGEAGRQGVRPWWYLYHRSSIAACSRPRKGDAEPPPYWRGLAGLQPVGDSTWRQPARHLLLDKVDDGSALLAQATHCRTTSRGRHSPTSAAAGAILRATCCNRP